MKRRYKIIIIVFATLVFILTALPYLIPIADNNSEASAQFLMSTAGRFLNIESFDIYVEEQGSAEEEAIVLIHGFGGSTFSWRNNMQFLADSGFRVIALDLKGFGLSGRDFQSDHSHKAQAAIINEVLLQTGIRQAYLIGHSMGGSVLFHFAHLYPEKVLGLISVDGSVILKKSADFPNVLLEFPPFQRAGRVILTNFLTKNRFSSILDSAYYNKEALINDVIDGYYDRAIRTGWEQSLLAMIRDMPQNAVNFPLNTLAFPTLIIRGDNDSWVSQSDMDAWRSEIPGAVFYLITGAGHVPMEEQPAVFNEIVLDFLQSIGNNR
jgi:pimeloyl-ACP methyl ester carboxylesterase